MNSDLTKKLNADFPEIFLFQHLGKQAGLFEFECGDGWYNILHAAFSSITHYIAQNNSQCDRFIEAQDMIDNGAKDEVPTYLLNRIEAIKNGNGEWPVHIDFPKAAQIKEKFGTLNIYMDYYDEATREVIGFAERMSATTCEECGNIGSQRSGGWIKILCDKHEDERQRVIAEREAERESYRNSMVDRT